MSVNTDVVVLAELKNLVLTVQRQNVRLKIVAVSIAALSVVLAIVVLGALFAVASLRNADLDQARDARSQVRLKAAEGDLRGCRADEQQDSVLANLLDVSLKLPKRPDETPPQTAARAKFQKVVDEFRKGRQCARQLALTGLPISERNRLLQTYPRAG